MLGVEDYGSDSDSDRETPQVSATSAHKTAPSVPAAKSGLSLPPPSASGSSKPSGLSLPAPKKRAPKKITIGLPALPGEPKDDDLNDRPPPAKKARLEAGAGASALLSMLPAPKNKNPVLPQPERMLGGGRGPGLVFQARPAPARSATVEDAEEEEIHENSEVPLGGGIMEEVKEEKPAQSLPFLPPSLAKGKANVSTEERHTISKAAAAAAKSAAPAIDFFSLGSSGSSASSLLAPRAGTSAPPVAPSISVASLPSVSSAPQIDDFTPPEPTPQDPYPGYYTLPSGQWAAYDAAYYKKFYDKWKKDYDRHVRALEKGTVKGFEGFEESAEEVNAAEEMERAKKEIQELEEKKSLTMGGQHAQVAPKMNIKGAALSGRAKGRHQLSTLLTEAYQNREALEDRIAQGRKNRKEAGNKYGF